MKNYVWCHSPGLYLVPSPTKISYLILALNLLVQLQCTIDQSSHIHITYLLSVSLFIISDCALLASNILQLQICFHCFCSMYGLTTFLLNCAKVTWIGPYYFWKQLNVMVGQWISRFLTLSVANLVKSVSWFVRTNVPKSLPFPSLPLFSFKL